MLISKALSQLCAQRLRPPHTERLSSKMVVVPCLNNLCMLTEANSGSRDRASVSLSKLTEVAEI